jgi:hypothetical protein
MVNFNSEALVALKTQELYEKCIMEKWYNVLEAFESYDNKFEVQQVTTNTIKNRLKTLYRATSGDQKRFWEKNQVIRMKQLLYHTEEYDQLEFCFDQLCDLLQEVSILGTKRIKMVSGDLTGVDDLDDPDEDEEMNDTELEDD